MPYVYFGFQYRPGTGLSTYERNKGLSVLLAD